MRMATAAAAMTRVGRLRAVRRDERLARIVIVVLVLGALWGGWELYKWIWETEGLTWPFLVDDTTMPHIHRIFAAFAQPTQTDGPLLITSLLKAAWFTAKEALAGFALGATVGFL